MKHSRDGSVRTGLQIFRIPLLLALLTGIGLTAALLGDDGWDVLSWISFLILAGVIGWALRPARRGTGMRRRSDSHAGSITGR